MVAEGALRSPGGFHRLRLAPVAASSSPHQAPSLPALGKGPLLLPLVPSLVTDKPLGAVLV